MDEAVPRHISSDLLRTVRERRARPFIHKRRCCRHPIREEKFFV